VISPLLALATNLLLVEHGAANRVKELDRQKLEEVFGEQFLNALIVELAANIRTKIDIVGWVASGYTKAKFYDAIRNARHSHMWNPSTNTLTVPRLEGVLGQVYLDGHIQEALIKTNTAGPLDSIGDYIQAFAIAHRDGKTAAEARAAATKAIEGFVAGGNAAGQSDQAYDREIENIQDRYNMTFEQAERMYLQDKFQASFLDLSV